MDAVDALLERLHRTFWPVHAGNAAARRSDSVYAGHPYLRGQQLFFRRLSLRCATSRRSSRWPR